MTPQTPTITSTTSEIINLKDKQNGRRKTGKKLSKEMILQILFEPLLESYYTFTDHHPRMKDVLRTTILACVQRTSIDDICSYLDDAINARTARYYLSWLKLDRIEKGMNDLLRREVLPLIKNKWIRLMIDLTSIPYYGTGKNDSEIRKSKAKDGTSKFHAYMTVYAVVRNHRYTIAIRYVRKEEELSAVVKDTLDGILGLNLNIRQVLADKEFYSTRVINYLKGIDIPFIIAVPERGCHIKALKNRQKGGRCMSWTIRNSRKEKATFCLQAYQKYMKGSKVLGGGATWFFYATYKMQKNPKRISDEYRMRFGIESSYRMMNTCRARTSSKDPALRLFYVLISFLIVNLKVLFEWLSRTDGRMDRRTSASLMRLKRLCRLIRKVFEAPREWRNVHRSQKVMAGG
jgi:putative transposase